MIDTKSRLMKDLKPGEAIRYWQLGATAEERFDVPDAPMKGEMDPFFFLTKHKNFIPHEYPCRTIFAEQLSRQAAGCAGRFRRRAVVAALRLAAARSVRLLVPPDAACHLGTHLRARRMRPVLPRSGSELAAARSSG